jgi:ribosome biogenesis GTPase
VISAVTTPIQKLSESLGTVVAVQANFYQVRLEQNQREAFIHPSSPLHPSSASLILCTRRTRLKKTGQKVMVGDRVLVETPHEWSGQGAIAEVLPRKTELDRPSIANAEQILLVFALEEPPLDAWQLSRFLVKAESTCLDLCLCLNKTDLATETQQQQWDRRLGAWGYNPVFISVTSERGLEQLMEQLRQKISIMAGPSGVGKSSLINYLIPAVCQRVGEVSGKLQRGRHTTRHVELFELPESGLLADTPGFNQPEFDCHPTNLALYFPEARERLEAGKCQFNDCLHRDEPNCSVRGDWERYEHYLKFLAEAIARQDTLQHIPHEESSLKLKIKESGQRRYEPKLESKKYRRHSRREKHQALHELYGDQTLEDLEE